MAVVPDVFNGQGLARDAIVQMVEEILDKTISLSAFFHARQRNFTFKVTIPEYLRQSEIEMIKANYKQVGWKNPLLTQYEMDNQPYGKLFILSLTLEF
jgi:hypothetical protein